MYPFSFNSSKAILIPLYIKMDFSVIFLIAHVVFSGHSLIMESESSIKNGNNKEIFISYC